RVGDAHGPQAPPALDDALLVGHGGEVDPDRAAGGRLPDPGRHEDALSPRRLRGAAPARELVERDDAGRRQRAALAGRERTPHGRRVGDDVPRRLRVDGPGRQRVARRAVELLPRARRQRALEGVPGRKRALVRLPQRLAAHPARRGEAVSRGYFSLVLHSHLPYVRHPEHAYFLEEQWFFEAM